MALDFSRIHSFNNIKKSKTKKFDYFPFERESVFPVSLTGDHSVYPFFERDIEMEDILFFDTETTGLSHGAGNMVFLAGIGYIDGGNFIVKQYFVSNPSVESQLIETVVGLFSKRKVVVSYNGKCFDIPIIKTRCLMNGVCEPDIEQIDLYHISRYIWRERLKRFRLIDVEKEVLGVERNGDLPGSLAPFAYREFLLRGNKELLERVFEHNLMDVYSLLKLYRRICEKKDAEVIFGAARKHFQEKRYRMAIDCLREVLKTANSRQLKIKAYLLAAQCFKKTGEFEKAVELWHRISEAESFVELAKYYEHKEKDYKKALIYTGLAIENVDKNSRLYIELKKRKTRLKGKTGFFDSN